MPHADFVHLRVHSAYSLSEGAIRVGELPLIAKEAGMPAVAITDTGNLFGALEFSDYCLKAGVQPIIGCQIGLEGPRQECGADASPITGPVVLLAMNPEGLANLQHLSSSGFLDQQTPEHVVGLETLLSRSDGLFLLTGGAKGPVGQLLADGQDDSAHALLRTLHARFGDRIAVEIQRHGTALEAAVEPGLIALADTESLPLVATNECFFARPAMHEAHEALLCIAQGRVVSDPDRISVTREHWFKDARAMRERFSDLPDACDNTLAIARRCAVMVEGRKPLLPVCPKVAPGSNEAETLRAMAISGLARRMDAIEADAALRTRYRERLDYELGVIEAMGFSGYFLIVADFIQWAKSQDIPVGPGRGSGAGSVAAWALTITDIDPLPFGLLFERFLNPERVSMPDFDIDFCQDRRDEVIEYVRREYGSDRVAQIITFGKLQARAAVRDVGRVLQLPFGLVNKVAELIPNNPAKPVTLAQAIEGEERLRTMRDEDEGVRRMLEIALQLEGLYRHASTHAAGVVIGDRPLGELVPLTRDPKTNSLVTQFNMKFVEQAGLVKFDFLGLTTLTILKRAVAFLAETGILIDVDRIPLDDQATFAMLARGDTAGVFQFEGAGMRDVLRQMRPDRLEDLIAAVALYRPGPMANIPDYCARKHGAAWTAPHEQAEAILQETYGIMVYQEQVMQIAQTMAGYSLGAADLLRRAMGKKIRAEMDKQRAIFTEGATTRGVPEAKAVEVFELMAKFADYGFNKSHAAAYALVSYQTAYMKANHPTAFLAACMSLAINASDKLAALKQEVGRLGIALLPPDINRSGADFRVEIGPDGRGAIRYALAAVKKVGLAAMAVLCASRDAGPFRDVEDFAARVDAAPLNRMQLENLVRAGAFDALEPNRARMLAGVDTILKRAQANREAASSGQAGLFEGAREHRLLRLPPVPDWSDMERLGFEAEAVGFHLTAHPLDAYRPFLRRLQIRGTGDLERAIDDGQTRVRLAGCVVDRKERPTRTGGKMAWLRLSDATGMAEITLFSEVLSRRRELLRAGQAVLATVDLKREGEALRVTAVDVVDLEQVAAEADGATMRVWVGEEAALAPIGEVLSRTGRGRGRIVLLPRVERGASRPIEVRLPDLYKVTPVLAQALKSLPGVARVEEV